MDTPSPKRAKYTFIKDVKRGPSGNVIHYTVNKHIIRSPKSLFDLCMEATIKNGPVLKSIMRNYWDLRLAPEDVQVVLLPNDVMDKLINRYLLEYDEKKVKWGFKHCGQNN